MRKSSYSHKNIYVCVDEYDTDEMSGRMYTGTSAEEWIFKNAEQMLMYTDEILARHKYPEQSTQSRTFKSTQAKSDRVDKSKQASMKESEAMKDNTKEMGNKSTFVISVLYRQNATWQGHIQWVDKNKKQNFRSALEMLKLMDEAVRDGEMEKEALDWDGE